MERIEQKAKENKFHKKRKLFDDSSSENSSGNSSEDEPNEVNFANQKAKNGGNKSDLVKRMMFNEKPAESTKKPKPKAD